MAERVHSRETYRRSKLKHSTAEFYDRQSPMTRRERPPGLQSARPCHLKSPPPARGREQFSDRRQIVRQGGVNSYRLC